MQLQPFGNTGLSVSPIGIGLAALGRPGYITLSHSQDIADTDVAKMEQHAHRVLDAAWDAGIRYYDAARSYGRAEEFLSSWLKSRNIAGEEVVVGSKWGYTYTADWQIDAETHEVKEHSLPVLDRQWEETRTFLGTHLDLYQVHSATLRSGILENGDVHQRLWQLKDNGTRIGLSLSGTGQSETLLKALEIRDGNRLLFDAVQATWNVLEPSVGSALQTAYDHGLGIIIKEVVANGRLTALNAENPDFADQYAILKQQADRLNTTIDAIAIAAALNQSWQAVVLSGAARVEHLQSNVKAVNVIWDDEAAQALSTLAETPDDYWQTRSNLAWN